MSIDDSTKSIEEALQKAENIDDILKSAAANFGDTLNACIDDAASRIEDSFGDAFKNAANTFSNEFSNVTNEIAKSMESAFDISNLRKELVKLKKGMSEAEKKKSDKKDKEEKKKGKGPGFFTAIMNDIVNLIGDQLDNEALAAGISQSFRQIQRGRGGAEQKDLIQNQIRQLKETLHASPEELAAVYGGAIQAGFTSEDMAKEDTRGMDLGEKMLKADKYLKLSAGSTSKMAEEIRSMSDGVDRGNVVEKILDMKIAAEKTGVSFTKFSNGAMQIGASLRPLGLDITQTTAMLEKMSANYREAFGEGSEQRAFEMAKKNLGAMGQSFAGMKKGVLAAAFNESDMLQNAFKGMDAYEAAVQMQLMVKGHGKYAGEEHKETRGDIMMEVLTSLVNLSEKQGRSYEQVIGVLEHVTKDQAAAAAAYDYVKAAEKPGADRGKIVGGMLDELEKVLQSDSDAIKMTAKASNQIKTLLASIGHLVISGIMKLVLIGDSILEGLSNAEIFTKKIFPSITGGFLSDDVRKKSTSLLLDDSANNKFIDELTNTMQVLNQLGVSVVELNKKAKDDAGFAQGLSEHASATARYTHELVEQSKKKSGSIAEATLGGQ